MRIALCLFILLIANVEIGKQVEYGGENFPLKYLTVDEDRETSLDLDRYTNFLYKSLGYFNSAPNETEINIALAVYLMKSILKRTLLDYSNKIKKYQSEDIRKLINMGENILSHYMYENAPYDWDDFEYRVSRIFELDASQIYSISDFNRNQLKQWIITKDNNIHQFTEAMDKAGFPKDEYCKVSNNFKDYNIDIRSSDECISRVSYNKEPIDLSQMQKCNNNTYCEERIYADPSLAYSLSHRFLNIYLRYSIKRCYIRSEEEDKALMHRLCANMYRESVYLARRGYFARDLFLEHVGLCGLLGYEEFHRKNWFNKATTWIKSEGCIVENRNFLLNRTKLLIKSKKGNVRQKMKDQEFFCKTMNSECDDHPTAVLLMVLAHAIRHAAYSMQ